MFMASMKRLVWVTIGKTDHQAWLLEDLDAQTLSRGKKSGGADGVLIEWDTTGDKVRVHRSSIHLEMPSRRRRVSRGTPIVVAETPSSRESTERNEKKTSKCTEKEDEKQSHRARKRPRCSAVISVTKPSSQTWPPMEPSSDKKRKFCKLKGKTDYLVVDDVPGEFKATSTGTLENLTDAAMPNGRQEVPAVESKVEHIVLSGSVVNSIPVTPGNNTEAPVQSNEKLLMSELSGGEQAEDSSPTADTPASQKDFQNSTCVPFELLVVDDPVEESEPMLIEAHDQLQKSMLHDISRRNAEISDRKTGICEDEDDSKFAGATLTRMLQFKKAGEQVHNRADIEGSSRVDGGVANNISLEQKKGANLTLHLEEGDGIFTKTQLRVFDEILTGGNEFTPKGECRYRRNHAGTLRSATSIHQRIIDLTPDSSVARRFFSFSKEEFYSYGRKGDNADDAMNTSSTSIDGQDEDCRKTNEDSFPALYAPNSFTNLDVSANPSPKWSKLAKHGGENSIQRSCHRDVVEILFEEDIANKNLLLLASALETHRLGVD